jgi:hypothetical protein
VCDSILFIGSSFKKFATNMVRNTNESASEVNEKKNETVRLRIYKKKKEEEERKKKLVLVCVHKHMAHSSSDSEYQ